MMDAIRKMQNKAKEVALYKEELYKEALITFVTLEVVTLVLFPVFFGA